MSVIHLDLTKSATRASIIDQVMSHDVDKESIECRVREAGIPDGHFHDIGVIDGVIDSLVGISDSIKRDIRGVYDTLAHAESHVHGVPVAKTHFHEVGESSTFKEILSICLAIDALDPDEIVATPIQLGSGKITCAHGILDVPAPATKAIVDRGMPMCEDRLDGELCTPTSAALIWHFVDRFEGDDRRHLLLTPHDVVRDLDPSVSYGLAFSGGVDSSLILACAMRYDIDVKPYMLATTFVSESEIADARKFAKDVGADLEEIPFDVLSVDEICANGSDRCYQCKVRLFGAIQKRMAQEGRTVLMDGSNATDDPKRRPGMRALSELSVRSPLREGGFTKTDVRRVSGMLGLPTSTKAKFSCFATRVPQGQRITSATIAEVARQ